MGSTKRKEEAKEAKEEKQEKQEKPAKEKHIEKKKEMKAIVRVINTDIDGDMPLIRALRGIKGISHAFANAVCITSGYNPKAKLGSLKEPDIVKVEDIIKNPAKFGIPSWLVNRRKDLESGTDIHLSGQDVDIGRRFDIQRLVDAKTYKGVRHMLGLPVRGQRTRSSFRKGRVVGVVRKSVRIVQQESKEEKK